MPHNPGAARPVPVTLLTGFLGSGKSSLLNTLLRSPALRDAAIIVNEFGAVSIDHDLVHRGEERYLVTSTGCLCCAAGSDIRASLAALMETEQNEGRSFSRVIVETTGLVDPAPIVNAIVSGASSAGTEADALARRFGLAGITTTVDAIFGARTLDRHIECWKQIAFADRIVLTKTDLARDPASQREVGRLKEWIATLNPTAAIVDREVATRDPEGLCGDGSFSIADKPEDVDGWLAFEAASAGTHDHGGDPNRHGDRIRTFAFTEETALDPGLFDVLLQVVLSQPGMLRLKGIVALADDPDRPVIVQGVQHILHARIRHACWPSADRRSRLVVIGDDLSPDTIASLFSAVRTRPRWWRRRRRAA